MRLRALGRRLLRNSSGGAALEFALVAPLLVALCFFAMEAAGAMMDYSRVVIAAEAGADAAIASPAASDEDIEAAAAFAFGERGKARLHIAISCDTGLGSHSQSTLIVQVSYAPAPLHMLGGAFSMTARSIRVAGGKTLCADDGGFQPG